MITLDCSGMLCPLPIIELGRAFASVGDGGELELIADDPAAATDVEAWCRLTGNDLVSTSPTDPERPGGATSYLIRRGRPSPP